MKRFLLGTMFGVCFMSSLQVDASFTDTGTHPYRQSIDSLQKQGVVKGYPDGSYGPDRVINRAELTKIILEASLENLVLADSSIPAYGPQQVQTTTQIIGDGRNCFSDVQVQWFARYVCYAYNNNIIKGYGDGRFAPNDSVTFAQALKITLNSFGAGVLEGSGDDRYAPYIRYVDSAGVLNKEQIDPNKAITRGEMAALVYPFMIGVSEWRKFSGGPIELYDSPIAQSSPITQSSPLGPISSYEAPIIPAETSTTQEIQIPTPVVAPSGANINRGAGCVGRQPDTAPTKINVGGVQRSIITAVGSKYDQSKKTPLIIAFHGRTNSNAQVKGYYGIERATGGNAIVVYPLGLPEQGPSRSWSAGGDPSDQLRDYAFFDAIVEQLSSDYCINKERIYVMGHSLGAWFSNSLACSRGDVIRAIGTVGGGTTRNECTGATAALIMHNPLDRLASFASGENARDQLLAQNSCGPETKPVGPSRGNCVEYTNCTADNPVIWCPHSDSTAYNGSYYPHTWPNGAGKYIWEFFQTHK